MPCDYSNLWSTGPAEDRPEWAIFECCISRDEHGNRVMVYTDVVCSVCGHAPCPSCRTWCDCLAGEDDDECCAGSCTYPVDEPRFWARPFKKPDRNETTGKCQQTT